MLLKEAGSESYLAVLTAKKIYIRNSLNLRLFLERLAEKNKSERYFVTSLKGTHPCDYVIDELRFQLTLITVYLREKEPNENI